MMQACFDAELICGSPCSRCTGTGVDAAILFSDIVVPLRGAASIWTSCPTWGR